MYMYIFFCMWLDSVDSGWNPDPKDFSHCWVLDSPIQVKTPIDHNRTMFVHFTYCSSMRMFPVKFHLLWQKYFLDSPINDIVPVLGTRNVDNLQRRLVHTRHRTVSQ